MGYILSSGSRAKVAVSFTDAATSAGAGARPRHPIFDKLQLSKSRFTAGLQCHKRLWLEVHEPDAPELTRTPAEQAILDRGIRVGEVARGHVPGGVLIDAPHRDRARRVRETKRAVKSGAQVLYEAAFFEGGIFVATDILEHDGGGWTLAEVKSTTKVKAAHIPDAAVQRYVLERAGLCVRRVEIMHLNRECQFPNLSNLFVRSDVTHETELALPSIPGEAKRQLKVLHGPCPNVPAGEHCHEPYECPFLPRCAPPLPNHHVSTLHRIRRTKVAELVQQGCHTIFDLPGGLVLSAVTERQRKAVVAGRMIVEPGLGAALAALEPPVAYLDFETVALAIPVWKGCRPYDAVPVQFSVHFEDGQHHEWIADGPADPREKLAAALVHAVRGAKRIAAYNSPFERRCIEHLRDNLPRTAKALEGVIARLVDVLPIVRDHVYHPDFGGSFSLKRVFPALLGRDGYAELEIADGGTASVELERLMFDLELTESSRSKAKASLLEYCSLDAMALVDLVECLRALGGPVGIPPHIDHGQQEKE